jgi:hypothetical protein
MALPLQSFPSAADAIVFGALETIQTISITIGILVGVASLIVALFAIFEKITGFTARWAGRQVAIGVQPLHNSIEELATYTRHHLGPNGVTMPLHHKVNLQTESLAELQGREWKRKDFNAWLDRLESETIDPPA